MAEWSVVPRRWSPASCVGGGASVRLGEPDAGPAVLAFADLWGRSQDGMSQAWCSRAARHWHAYLLGYLDEADKRGRCFAMPEYLRVRRDTVGAQPVLASRNVAVVSNCPSWRSPAPT
jgi:hypothetical protein